MAKKKLQAQAEEQTQPTGEIGTPALSVTIQGQMFVKSEKVKTAKHYEETFLIPTSFGNRALQTVLRCLLYPRLAAKHENFVDVRKHELKSPPRPANFVGLKELFAKNVYDMNPEELRTFILFKNIKYPVSHYDANLKKRVVTHVLDAIELIKRNQLDIDLAEKTLQVMKMNPSQAAEPVIVEEEVVEDDGYPGEEGVTAATKPAGWENLDQ